MRHLILFVCLICLAGCQSAEEIAALRQYEQHMEPEWLKAHIIIGKTTKSEVEAWFGVARSKMSYAGSAFMPDEMWTYSVRFSENVGSGLNVHEDARVHTIVFTFKSGVVSAFNTASVH